ncbi:hypothetical protein F4778DRAFT_695466 [Xylariomycetidae sp. FL2044]|nr:hypothetical protein F4778DRAFT_695466 [Xylariomycetidae sp. FL2044]
MKKDLKLLHADIPNFARTSAPRSSSRRSGPTTRSSSAAMATAPPLRSPRPRPARAPARRRTAAAPRRHPEPRPRRKIQTSHNSNVAVEHNFVDTRDYYIPHTRTRGYLLTLRCGSFGGQENTARILAIWKRCLLILRRRASWPVTDWMLPATHPLTLRA